MAFRTGGVIVYTREDWGARPARGRYSPLGETRSGVYHHGGPVGGLRLTKRHAVLTARSWQNYHMDVNGWADIGYHLLMDALGRWYAGRPANALGAHTANQNSHRLGWNYMQDGRFHGLTPLQKRSTRLLFTQGLPKIGVPPLMRLIKHPGGEYGVFPHRFFGGTECPGDLIDRDVKQLIREVSR